ncbi:MAG TPA: ABC transporter permease [Lachnospiraceae bacterium]|jgi:rhamnose transport system permease protein|nr:ABC transporter permease [Lachnospiraceae bacterium]HAL31444.1 ABC transporter permease [Lachnospiraceae bacterium]HCS00085.1 ABC transporter permease [Lachnospiraceae bacterium]
MKKKSLIQTLTGSREMSLVAVLIVLLVIIEIMSPSFLSPNNLSQIFRNNALTMLMALGMLCVMLTAGIDISITSTLAFAGMTIGMLQKHNVLHNTFLLFLIGAVIGLACGFLNGIIIAKAKVAPIICTMGFMYIWRGMAYVISGNTWASGADVAGFSDFGKEGSAGPYLILIAAYIIFFVFMKWTRFGRKIYAVGSNAEAARISGINVDRTMISVYTIMGLLAGLAGVLSVSIYASAQPNMQYGKEMDVIAACVIGGVSMSGGRGSVTGTFLGALIIAIIAKALPLVGIDSIAQNLVKGIIILAVVILNVVTQRMMDHQNLVRREM